MKLSQRGRSLFVQVHRGDRRHKQLSLELRPDVAWAEWGNRHAARVNFGDQVWSLRTKTQSCFQVIVFIIAGAQCPNTRPSISYPVCRLSVSFRARPMTLV